MKAEIKKQKDTKVEIDFELSWEEFEVYYQKAINKISQGISLDGFRQGKAPKEIIEQKVGDYKILEESAEIALQENYLKAVKENNLEVIGPPQVEIVKLAKGNEFQAKIKINILPEVRLPDYQKIVSKIEKKKSKVEDKEIWKDDILKAISNEIKIEMPEILVLSEKERILHNIENKTEKLEKEALERANQRVKNYLILKEIGKKEGIEVLEEDIDAEINRILASYPQINPKEIDKESLKGVLYNNKVFEVLEKLCH